MIFPTRVHGIHCRCSVIVFDPGTPASISGPPENRNPGDPGEFEFELLDRRGRRAAWLDRYVTDEVTSRLYEDAHILRQAEERQAADDFNCRWD